MNREGCIKKLLLLTLLVSQALMFNLAVAQQCFNRAEDAYAYLIHQDQISQQRISASNHMPLNINTASEAELTTLKGIGSHKAQAIIRYREAFGRFAQVDDLSEVKGIGDKTVANNRSRLKVN